MANKMKAWRKMGELHNIAASIKNGAPTKHQGRANKVQYFNAAAIPSTLIGNMLVKAADAGNYTMCFTKKQLAALAAQVAERAKEIPNETE